MIGTPRSVALLRAINVGGRRVKMDHLRSLFEGMGLANVRTFIASGNVVFDAPDTGGATLERRIEQHLRDALGYHVDTFLRSAAEMEALAAHRPFAGDDADAAGHTLYVAFLAGAPDETAARRLLDFRGDADDFHVHGREIYWLARKKVRESEFSGAVLEKTLGMPATLRNVSTVRKLADLCGAG
jgi:uncharacterized protein (DUF1697 family)